MYDYPNQPTSISQLVLDLSRKIFLLEEEKEKLQRLLERMENTCSEQDKAYQVLKSNMVEKKQELENKIYDESESKAYYQEELKDKMEEIERLKNVEEKLELAKKKIEDWDETAKFHDLELDKDNNSEYGLVFKLRENANIMQGDLAKYTGSSSLSRLIVGETLELNSISDSLGLSYSVGRIIIVSGEAVPIDLKKFL